MKKIRFAFRQVLLTAITASIAFFENGASYAIVVDKTVSVGAGGTRAEDSSSGNVMDNFNDGGVQNLWGGVTGTFNDAGGNGTCTLVNDSTSPYEGAYCLKINYNVNTTGSYSGYFSLLQSKNVSAYKTLSFWIKGASGGEFFKIELKNNSADANRNRGPIYITDYLDDGVTTSWRYVEIPFHNFANISDWTSMKEFVIVFENVTSNANGSPKASSIYIDQIQVNSPASVATVRIDHFGDNVGLNALGGGIASGGGGGTCVYSFSATSGQWHNYSRGLRLDYNVTTSGSYSYCAFVFGGGSDAWQKIPHNFSEYNYISFWIRANTTTTNPEGIKIELHDFSGGSEPFYVINKGDANRITTTWKQFKIPLSSFKDFSNVVLDKTRISELVFTFENGNATYKTGIVFIDEVQFEK